MIRQGGRRSVAISSWRSPSRSRRTALSASRTGRVLVRRSTRTLSPAGPDPVNTDRSNTELSGAAVRVGFIGLGHMGGPMSANILGAGHDLVVHDVREEAADGLRAAGAAWASSPRETGEGRDVVITMLPTPRHVADVLLGPDGLLDGL